MTLFDFFKDHPRVALAFSGGVDSAYLLYASMKAGAQVKAYYVKTPFQPIFELEDARRLAVELNAEMEILEADPLEDPNISKNSGDRCYHCKKVILSHILSAARRDGFEFILDGTNASDDASDRPGMRALAEMRVLSPLRLCGLIKDRIRALSREAGLFTWDKPAYACLATRIPTGTAITRDMLTATEQAEAALTRMGLRDFRVRWLNGAARLQVTKAQLPLVLEQRHAVLEALKPYYTWVLLDLEERP